MKSEDPVEYVDVGQLRIGMFVELGVGWMDHPFPSGSFKISSARQIDSIRALGLARVRYIAAKSDPLPASPVDSPSASATEPEQPQNRNERAGRSQRAQQLGEQQQLLQACERRFGDAARQYRKTLDTLRAQPQLAAEQCRSMVDGFLGEMLADGESVIRLLSETAGERSAMHPVNVTVVALLLGKALGLHGSDLEDLGMAAFLHDVGKLELPERVRWPDDNYTSAEYRFYQEHVAKSLAFGQAMGLSRGALAAIAQHHELVDGSGFPERLRSQDMSVPGRILSLVNRYDNLCNPARSSAAMTPHEALALLFAQHKSRFDSVALSAFIRMMGVYPPGSVVQLLDDRYAIVVSVNSARPLKPCVIVHDPVVPRHEALIVNLEQTRTLGIRRSIKPLSLPAPALEYLAPRQRICYFFDRAAEMPATSTLA